MFKEITPEEFSGEYNILHVGKDWAAASADDGTEKNSLIIGWAGLGILWGLPTFTVYVHESRYSKHIFDGAEYFSVSILVGENREKHLDAWKYLGSVSGRDEDKFAGAARLGLNGAAAEMDGASVPYFAESDYVVICKKTGMTDFDVEKMDAPDRIMNWYSADGVHTIYEGRIVKVLKKEG